MKKIVQGSFCEYCTKTIYRHAIERLNGITEVDQIKLYFFFFEGAKLENFSSSTTFKSVNLTMFQGKSRTSLQMRRYIYWMQYEVYYNLVQQGIKCT